MGLGPIELMDFSNYDEDLLAHPERIDTLRDDFGLKYAIVGCQSASIARALIPLLRSKGVKVIGTYAFLYWGRVTLEEAMWAVDVAAEFGIPYVWLDCEAYNEMPSETPVKRVAELQACVDLVEGHGLKCGIYTGSYFWQGNMQSSAFARLPLWLASYYDDRRRVQVVNFGGWKFASVHQFASTPAIAGRERDQDYLNDMAVTEGEDEMTQDQFNEMFQKAMGAFFPGYIEAYFRSEFTSRNGSIGPGEEKDNGPLKPWLADIAAEVPDVIAVMTACRDAFDSALKAVRTPS